MQGTQICIMDSHMQVYIKLSDAIDPILKIT